MRGEGEPTTPQHFLSIDILASLTLALPVNAFGSFFLDTFPSPKLVFLFSCEPYRAETFYYFCFFISCAWQLLLCVCSACVPLALLT